MSSTWCENDKRTFIQCANGQINPQSAVGSYLMKLVEVNHLRTVVDIGTWNGMGSTRCFLLSLQGEDKKNTEFISLEVNFEKNQIAKENLKELLNDDNKKLVWGSVLRPNDIKRLNDVFPELLINSEFNRWHTIDVENLQSCPYVIDQIPEEIDLVLFDGGEFTTYYEFLKLLPRCKRFIAMDDVNVCKCMKMRSLLLSHPDWKEIAFIPQNNGFSIFERVQ